MKNTGHMLAKVAYYLLLVITVLFSTAVLGSAIAAYFVPGVAQITERVNMTIISSVLAVILLGYVSGMFLMRRRFNAASSSELSKLAGALRSKDEQAAILIQSIADGVIVTDTEGKINLMNRTAANMTGWTVEEAININVEQVFKVAKENGEEIPKEEYPFTAVLAHN